MSGAFNRRLPRMKSVYLTDHAVWRFTVRGGMKCDHLRRCIRSLVINGRELTAREVNGWLVGPQIFEEDGDRYVYCLLTGFLFVLSVHKGKCWIITNYKVKRIRFSCGPSTPQLTPEEIRLNQRVGA